LEIPPKALRATGGLAVGALGGALCAWLGTPLPWMIGSIFGMAVVQLAGAGLEPLPGGRDAGQLVIGVGLGVHFTVPVVREVSAYWPWFVFLGFAAIGLGAVSALVLARLGGVDRATAYFGSMPGAAADMAQLGERHGGLPDRIAFSHSVRLLFVVTLVPAGITLAGFTSNELYADIDTPLRPAGLALLMAIGLASGWLFRKLRAPTAFTMGPLVVVTALTVAGLSFSSIPALLTNAAQVLLGCALGARFDRGFLKAAPRFVLALMPAVAVTLGLAALVGWGIAATSGVYLGTALLAAAPGGIAEMAITAQVLRIGVAFVTAAHVVRYLIVVLFTIPVYHLLEGARARIVR
jgi:uncharacterized protein